MLARGVTVKFVGFVLVLSWTFVSLPLLSAKDEPSPPKVMTNSIGMKLTLIPKGDYLMGEPEGEEGPGTDAKPRHRVEITRAFYMGTYEVTRQEFDRVMDPNAGPYLVYGANNRGRPQDASRYPVENVTWFDAVKFCNTLSEKEHREPYYKIMSIKRKRNGAIQEATVNVNPGGGYRLPTEAEWEYACRAGRKTSFHFGASLNGQEANCNGHNPYGTSEQGPNLAGPTTVGSYRANPFGLFDMHGNVCEWCSDRYDGLYYRKSPARDPLGPDTGSERVVRGGSWSTDAEFCRAACRCYYRPDFRDSNLGFRMAITPLSQ
jgi:sulfatase modifying factor 1